MIEQNDRQDEFSALKGTGFSPYVKRRKNSGFSL
jgi:hypothetical protein